MQEIARNHATDLFFMSYVESGKNSICPFLLCSNDLQTQYTLPERLFLRFALQPIMALSEGIGGIATKIT